MKLYSMDSYSHCVLDVEHEPVTLMIGIGFGFGYRIEVLVL